MPREREVQIISLVAAGLNNEQIAQALCLAVDTVKTHVRRAMASTGAQNRAHLVTWGFLAGALSVEVDRVGRPALDQRDVDLTGVNEAPVLGCR